MLDEILGFDKPKPDYEVRKEDGKEVLYEKGVLPIFDQKVGDYESKTFSEGKELRQGIFHFPKEESEIEDKKMFGGERRGSVNGVQGTFKKEFNFLPSSDLKFVPDEAKAEEEKEQQSDYTSPTREYQSPTYDYGGSSSESSHRSTPKKEQTKQIPDSSLCLDEILGAIFGFIPAVSKYFYRGAAERYVLQHNNLSAAVNFSKADKPLDAIEYYCRANMLWEALALARKHDLKDDFMRTLEENHKYLQAAEFANHLNQIDKAIELYKRAAVTAKGINDHWLILRKAARLAMDYKKIDEAKEICRQGHDFVNPQKNKLFDFIDPTTFRYANELAETYEQLKKGKNKKKKSRKKKK